MVKNKTIFLYFCFIILIEFYMKIVCVEPIGISKEKAEIINKEFVSLGHEFVFYNDRKEDEDSLRERMKDADIVIISNIKLSSDVLRTCPNLKMLSVAFTGIDHIDLDYCNKNNIKIFNASGYATVAVANEDWLISPLVYMNNYHNEKLAFYTATSYTGPALEVLVSGNYSGQGNPNLATWTPLTATLSSGSWTWTPSGYIDFTGYGDAIRVAFKYTSTSTEAATWEVDNIMILGSLGTGVSEINAQSMVSVRPNPVVEDINVYYNGNGTAQAILYDLTGASVAQAQLVNGKNTMSGRSLSTGMYILKVISSEMKQVYTQKIIVK